MAEAADSFDEDYIDRLVRLDERLRQDPANQDGSLDGEGVAKEDERLLRKLHQHWRGPNPSASTAAGRSIYSLLGGTRDVGLVLGRFQIERELGRGGFGVVFQAFDPQRQRSIALKVPRPEVFAGSEARQRFLLEAKAAAQFEHPNVVEVLEVGTVGEICFIVFDCAPGGSLADRLVPGTPAISPEQSAELLSGLASGVAYVHACGMLHRDIKPSNVLLWPAADDEKSADEPRFIPRLTDFGLAKFVDASLLATGTSVLLGTPLYMAPEQAACDHEGVGPWTDVYSLGVILYELLAGRPPFVGPGLAAVLDQLRTQEPAPPRQWRPGIPKDLERICLRCLAKEPADRYQTAAELQADLGRFLRGQPVLARGRSLTSTIMAWLRQPQRVHEAGVYMVILNGAVIAWMLIEMPYFLLAPGVQVDAWAMTRDCAIVAATLDVPQIVVGGFTILRHRWAVWCGLILAAVNVAFSLAGQIGWFVPFGNLYDESATVRILMFGFMSAMFFVELFLFIAATIAISSSRKRPLSIAQR